MAVGLHSGMFKTKRHSVRTVSGFYELLMYAMRICSGWEKNCAVLRELGLCAVRIGE